MLYNNIQIQSIDKPIRISKKKICCWLSKLTEYYSYEIISLSISICSDKHLLTINKKYLNHNYYTDIITFDLRDKANHRSIEGDLYISLDRIRENAKTLSLKTEEELLRVIAHGTLHLIGYKDKTPAQKLEMQEAENRSLSLYKSLFHVK